MIYHFCDTSFGAAFIAQSEAFAQERHVPITLVYSERHRASQRTRSSRALRNLVRRLTNPYVTRLYVDDVNAPSFRLHIQPGDHGIITGFNQIFSACAITSFESFINVHPSLLPFYRGPAPTQWCLLQGEMSTGFTFHEVTASIDEGPILYQEIVPIGESSTSAALSQAIAERAAPVYRRYLQSLIEATPWPRVFVNATDVYARPLGYCSAPRAQQ